MLVRICHFSPWCTRIEVQFNIKNKVVSTLTTSLYVLGFGIGPFVLAPLSELYGRKPVYCSTLTVFVILQIGCALSSSITTLITLRLLSGCFGSVAPSLGPASMSDLWGAHERGIWNSFLSIGVLSGPPMGTVIASLIVSKKSWTWIFWVTAMISGALLFYTLFVFRETYEPVILRRRAQLRKSSKVEAKKSVRDVISVFSRAFSRPIRFLIFNPVVLVVSAFAAYSFSMLYLILVSLPLLFGTTTSSPSSTPPHKSPSSLFSYSFNPSSKGLAYLGLVIGFFIAGIFQMNAQSQIYRRLSKRHGEGRPEYRLLPMMVSVWMFPIGLLWYGWSAEAEKPWIMPEVGLAIFAFGVFVNFQSVQIYLAEAFIPYGASAVAAATLLRSCAGAAFPLFGQQMFLKLGYGWASTVLALIALPAIPIPWVLYVNGGRLRDRFHLQLQ